MITFEEFCTLQMLGGEDKEAFRTWLGNTVDTVMSERSWLKWFARWMRERGTHSNI